MEYNPHKREIKLNKKLSNLDKFVIKFTDLLDEYVIVSGYVSILLGRTRATEDVDLLIPHLEKEKFENLWKKIHDSGFICVTNSDPDDAFDMLKETAIRFSRPGKPLPNIEFKTIKTDLDKYSYENRIVVILNQEKFFISPLEMQIVYKLFLAADGTDEELKSDKDVEDARHLYKVFEEKLNKEELLILLNKLNVEKKLRLLK